VIKLSLSSLLQSSVSGKTFNVTKDSISNKTKHLEFVLTMLKTVSYFFVETDTFYFSGFFDE